MAVSREIAGAGTGEPAADGDPADPTAASPNTAAQMHASAAAARASGRAAVTLCMMPPTRIPNWTATVLGRLHAARLIWERLKRSVTWQEPSPRRNARSD